jgi:hypothetical protein
MKKAKMLVVSLVLLMAMAVTGCTKVESITKVNKDGSGVGILQLKVSKTDAVARMGSILTEADVDAFFAKSGYELKSEDGKSYYVRESTKEYGKGELIRGVDGDTASKYKLYFLYSELDGQQLKYQLKTEMNFDNTQQQLAQYGITLSEDDFTYAVTYEFPEKVINTNGKIDPNNSKRVTFDIDFNAMNVIFASTNKQITLSNVKTFASDQLKVANTKIEKAKAKKTSITVKMKKVKGAKYHVQCSTKKNFSGSKYRKSKKNVYTIKKLKSKTKYYVRVRTYRKNAFGNTIYGKWKKTTVKTK